MLNWLNQNNGATLALLTAIYVVATIVLVIVTVQATKIAQNSLKAAERFERERSRPYVTVSLINKPLGTIQILVRNVGATGAYAVRIQTAPEILILEGGKDVFPSDESEKRHPFISVGFPLLPPKTQESSVVSLSCDRFRGRYQQRRFEGSVSYQDKEGHRYEDPLVIDLSVKEGMTFIADYDIGTELHLIRKLLEKRKA